MRASWAPTREGGYVRANPLCMDAGIISTLQYLQGPEIFWGAEGPSLGYRESDIKGYDGFGRFVAAIQAYGIDLSTGEYTVLAPADSAFVR